MKSEAKTVDAYLAELPAERRSQIEKVRNIILKNLPAGFEEVMNWGMITYQVPLARYPDTYNGQPLVYAGLASQKNYMSIYLMGIYADEETRREFEDAYEASGKKLKMGKSCVRFRKIEDLPLPVIGRAIAAIDIDTFMNAARQAHAK